MGLDTTHNAWHGPYSSFNKWREWIAKQIGIDLKSMVGFGGETPWDNFKNHDLYPLLNHSDCDGILTPEECKKIAEGLQDVIDGINAREYNSYAVIDNVEYTQQFIEGCELAAAKNENLEFQ